MSLDETLVWKKEWSWKGEWRHLVTQRENLGIEKEKNWRWHCIAIDIEWEVNLKLTKRLTLIWLTGSLWNKTPVSSDKCWLSPCSSVSTVVMCSVILLSSVRSQLVCVWVIITMKMVDIGLLHSDCSEWSKLLWSCQQHVPQVPDLAGGTCILLRIIET